MKTTVVTMACIFCFTCSHAQEPAKKRFNMMLDYSVGLQFLSLDRVEQMNSWYYLNAPGMKVAPGGWSEEPEFGPTVMNHVGLAFSICRKRSLFFELNADWGWNEITSHRYSTGKQAQASNPAKATSRMVFWLLSLGYKFKKEISIGKWGALAPGIGFGTADGGYITYAGYEVKDKNTGEVVEADYDFGRTNGIVSYSFRNGFLMLLDNPRVGVDYKVKLINNIYFKASYSYWLLGTMPNNLYGLSKRYLVKFKGMESRNIDYLKSAPDFSHNLSIGLLLSLR